MHHHLIFFWFTVQLIVWLPKEPKSITIIRTDTYLVKRQIHFGQKSNRFLSEAHQNANQVICQVRSLKQLVIE